MRWRMLCAAALASASSGAGLAACGASAGRRSEPRPAASRMALSSAAFRDGSSIPRRYTCDGENVSPPLAWGLVPVRARTLALLVEDPGAPGGAFVHWSVYRVSARASGTGAGRPPPGSAQGRNSFGRLGYGGPCPPTGERAHRYVFSIDALDDDPKLPAGASPAAVRAEIAAHAIAAGVLTGVYRR